MLDQLDRVFHWIVYFEDIYVVCGIGFISKMREICIACENVKTKATIDIYFTGGYDRCS